MKTTRGAVERSPYSYWKMKTSGTSSTKCGKAGIALMQALTVRAVTQVIILRSGNFQECRRGKLEIGRMHKSDSDDDLGLKYTVYTLYLQRVAHLIVNCLISCTEKEVKVKQANC